MEAIDDIGGKEELSSETLIVHFVKINNKFVTNARDFI